MSIGELAKVTGVKVVTIRYYEQIGVIPAPARTTGNYRVYRQEHLQRLQFAQRCRKLGFPLDEVRDLLHLSGQAERECAGVDRITAKHLQDIERRIADLRRLASELRRIQNRCSGEGRIAGCRILEALFSQAPSKRTKD
jgi:Cu(I)-responsive transcriptional regulator